MILRGKPVKIFENALVSTIIDAVDILDIGTPQRFHKELRQYSTLFEGKRYIAAGYMPKSHYGKYNADCHQDIEAMTFPDASFDAVLCIEVLEHVRRPGIAIQEIYRILRPGGKLFLTTPFLYAYHGKGSQSHDHDSYPDFWRFTHEGLELLLAEYSEVSVSALHGPLEARLLSLRLWRLINLPIIRGLLDWAEKPNGVRGATRLLAVARK